MHTQCSHDCDRHQIPVRGAVSAILPALRAAVPLRVHTIAIQCAATELRRGALAQDAGFGGTNGSISCFDVRCVADVSGQSFTGLSQAGNPP